MNKLFFYLLLFLTTNTFAQIIEKNTGKNEQKILEIVLYKLKEKHINDKKIDDDFSKKLFKTYIDSLDTNKIFFLQSDIDEFKKFETKIDDQIKQNDITFFSVTYDRIMMRMQEGKEIYTNVLKNRLDFTKNEETVFDPKNPSTKTKIAFAKTKADLNIKWVNFLKTVNISESSKIYLQQNKKPYLEILKEYSLNLGSFIESTNFNYNIITRADVFQRYVNSILAQYDPHSNYFIPKNREKYLNKQTGKLTGIGVKLYFIDGFVQIIKIKEGGPAYKTNKFNEGDVILKIAEEKQLPINVTGFSTFDVTQLLKGKPKTTIEITVKKVNGKIIEIPVKREIVAMNDYYVKSCVVTKGKSSYGIISFPRFYNDFDDEQAKNAADDIFAELEMFKKINVDGIILDIRDNAGGSVEAALKIAGNFINKSSLLQIKGKEANVTILQNENLVKNWDKNLIVLTNNKTASAAEIIAATVQENNLGILVGSKTFGKGTIQEFLDINVFTPVKVGNIDMGALNISIQKFYLRNGKSVQKKGVVPDIEFFSTNIEDTEANTITALAPDEVKPLTNSLKVIQIANFENIIQNSKSRFLADKKFQLSFKKDVLKQNILKNILKIRTLNADRYANQLKTLQTEKLFEPEMQLDETRTFKLSSLGEQEIKQKPYLQQKRNIWLDNLKTDYQIYEGINILEDMELMK